MSIKTIETYVNIDVDLSEWSDKELIDEMKYRGYTCLNKERVKFKTNDWQLLLELLDKQPRNWEIDQVREKVFKERFEVE